MFEDDEVFIRKLIGNRYNAYLKYKDRRDEISNIYEYGSIYAIELFDDDFYRNYMFLDNSLNFLFKLDDGIYIEPVIYSFDNLIYVMNREFNTENNLKIDIYRKDGVKIDTLLVDDILDYTDGRCGVFTPDILAVHDNYLYILYSFQEGCSSRIEMNDVSEIVKDQEYISVLTMKYKLNYEIETVESTDGDFTYEEKEDEDGKTYVELKISPKQGYMVDEIIVTDIYGDRIEVTDNKFYKPMTDVKIEVQYKEVEEYVPIPDTFLGKSLGLILIGFILIGLGVYTINYVKE